MLNYLKLLTFAILSSAVLFSQPAYACPAIAKIPDFNCDGKLQIAIIGDSLVSGFGDTKNGNQGGYVLRTQNKLPNVDIINLGKQGMFTRDLLSLLNDAFQKGQNADYKKVLIQSDVVVLDLGRNDRWFFGPPLATFRNLKKAAQQIKSKAKNEYGTSPFVVTAVLMLPNRGSQGPWVKELNSIIRKNNSNAFPADLRFDLVSKRLLSKDQIHPTPEGYTQLAATFVKYLTKTLPKKLKKLRPDADKDGIPDIFETKKFGTDPKQADTDMDGKSDFDEIFVLKSDPLVAD